MEHDAPPPGAAESFDTRRPIQENVKSKATWLRLFFMLCFVVAYAVAELVATVVVAVQFFWVLLNGAPNERLRELGQSLAIYTYQIILYLTFNSDERPFPIDMDWPTDPPDLD
ncbi:MAG TPA: DUF4389 domain-containing protein [Gammaproteobacteria bacterium]